MLVEVRTKKTQPASDTRSCCSDRLSRTRLAAARQAKQLESATHVEHYTEALRDRGSTPRASTVNQATKGNLGGFFFE